MLMGSEITVSEGVIGTYANLVDGRLVEEGIEIFISGLGGRRANHMSTGVNLGLEVHRSIYPRP